MLAPLNRNTLFPKEFDRSSLIKLQPYFDFDLRDDSDRLQFFRNLLVLAEQDLSMAHNLQHSQTALVAVSLGDCQDANRQVLDKKFTDIIGCISALKRSDTMTFVDGKLDGQKNWISNLDIADYGVINVAIDGKNSLVYFNRHHLQHQVITDYYDPIGMERTKPYSLRIDHQSIPSDYVLGTSGGQELFEQSNFSSYCFITNHLGLTKGLFKEIRDYAQANQCGADHDIKKLEMAICSLELLWESHLDSVLEKNISNRFWNERNTQYAISKRTLIELVQLILELGVSYYTDVRSEFSQRFRDALTYVSHMHSLNRFGKEFFMLDLYGERP